MAAALSKVPEAMLNMNLRLQKCMCNLSPDKLNAACNPYDSHTPPPESLLNCLNWLSTTTYNDPFQICIVQTTNVPEYIAGFLNLGLK